MKWQPVAAICFDSVVTKFNVFVFVILLKRMFLIGVWWLGKPRTTPNTSPNHIKLTAEVSHTHHEMFDKVDFTKINKAAVFILFYFLQVGVHFFKKGVYILEMNTLITFILLITRWKVHKNANYFQHHFILQKRDEKMVWLLCPINENMLKTCNLKTTSKHNILITAILPTNSWLRVN